MKANGMIAALAKMSAKEREQLPTGRFANDYNQLRKLALEVMPDKEAVLPPEVEVLAAAQSRGDFGQARYVEILAYCSQIRGLLVNLVAEGR